MPLTYKRTAKNRQKWEAEHMKNAIKEVNRGILRKTVTQIFNMPRISLKQHVVDKSKVVKKDR